MVEDRHKAMGRTVVRLREAKGWSQETLAHEAASSVKTISRLENGKHEGRGSTMRNVAKALGVPVADLLQLTPVSVEDGLSQMDRIEAKLDTLLAALTPNESPADVAEAEAARIEAQRTQDAQGRKTRRRTPPAA